jgi:UDP-glucosyltransferase BX8/BX9
MRKRVLLFPLPYQGHINPMLEIAAILHSHGFSIIIFHTNFNSIDSTKYPSYRFVLVEDGGISSRFRPVVGDTVHRLIAWNDCCEQLFHGCLTSVLSEQNEEPVVCLIRDTHWYNLQYIANKLGVPTLVLRTGSAATLNWFMAFPKLADKGLIPVKGQYRTIDFLLNNNSTMDYNMLIMLDSETTCFPKVAELQPQLITINLGVDRWRRFSYYIMTCINH